MAPDDPDPDPDAPGVTEADADPEGRPTGGDPYVHRPAEAGDPTVPADRADEEFGRQEWLLVAAVLIALVVVPVVIYVRPPGVPFLIAYIALPLIPAFVLAAIAVWVTTTP